MISKNRTKKSIFLFLAALSCVHCSSVQTQGESPSYVEKLKSAQDAASQAQKGYETATKLTKQFSFKNEPGSTPGTPEAPANIPPPSSVTNLPKYGSALERAFGKVISVSIVVEMGANNNSPIVFDLVFVKNAETYTTLTTILAQDWFRVDNQQIAALKKQKNLFETQEITVLPERRTYSYLVRVPAHAKAGLLFVRLMGSNRMYPTGFDPYKNINLEFVGSHFQLNSQNQ